MRPSLFVNVSLHVHNGTSDRRSYVEVEDDVQTLALLTSMECLAPSRALLQAAAVVADEDQDQLEHIRHQRLVEQIEAALSEAWIPLVGAAGTA
jgi:hypothetical protein